MVLVTEELEKIGEYEVVLVLNPEVTDDEANAVLDKVVGVVTELGGKLIEQHIWGLRPLAFPVKRFNEGNYQFLQFSLGRALVSNLNQTLNANEDVLRFLITTLVREKKTN